MNKEQEKRFLEIEQRAINSYLDKTDFDISEWIYEIDKKEWRALKILDTGECPFCGELSECYCK